METLLHVGLSNAAAATALALLAAVVSLRSNRPALVHGLWLLVLLKLVTPPLVRIPIQLPPAALCAAAPETVEPFAPVERSEATAAAPSPVTTGETVALAVDGPAVVRPVKRTAGIQEAGETATSTEHDSHTVSAANPLVPIAWDRLLLFAWMTGSAGWLLVASWRVVRFHRLLAHAQPVPAAWQARADELAKGMRLASSPPVLFVPGRLPPMLWVIGRPRLLLPLAFQQHVGPGPLEALLAHELAHLRRRDHWVRVLEFLTLGLYWWLPVAWYACRRLREAEEQCCDAWVVATLPGSGKTYARAILDTLDFLSSAPTPPPLLASGLGQVTDLKRRLRMIMTGTTPRALGWRGFAAVLVLGLLLLPLLPALVQGQPGEEREQPRPPEKREPQQVSDKVKAELKQLQAEVNKKAAELAEAGKKLQEAAQKLSPGEGRRRGPIQIEGLPPIPPPSPGGGEPAGFILRKMDDNWILVPMPGDGRWRFGGRGERGPSGTGERGPGERRGERGGPGDRGGRERPMPPDDQGRPGIGGGAGRPGQGAGRTEELERRLDAVMRQLDEIRRELGPRRGGPGEPPPPPRSRRPEGGRPGEDGGPPPERKPPRNPDGRE